MSEEAYCDFLDELYGEVNIGGITYPTSQAMQAVDPIAFRCGYADWASFEEEEDEDDD